MPAFSRPNITWDEATLARWSEFDALGVAEVRRRLASSQYGETKAALARVWIEHQESVSAAADRESTIKEARTANDLASEANATASRAAEAAVEAARAARKSNIIALAALLVAMISIITDIFRSPRFQKRR